MKIRLKLSIRMILLITSSAAIVFFLTLQIISNNFKKVAVAEAKAANDNLVKKYASLLQTAFETDFNKIRHIKQLFESNQHISYTERRELYDNILKTILEENKNYQAVWDTWELGITDKKWQKNYGRISRSFYRHYDNTLKLKIDSLDMEGDNLESLYYMFKLVPEEAITDPYYYSYSGLEKDNILESSLVVPLNIDNQFAGLVGIDLKLDFFQKIIDSINHDQSINISFFAFNGDIVAHPVKAFCGQNIVVVDTFLTSRFNILDHIQSGIASNYTLNDHKGNDSVYFTMASFTIGNTNTPWALLITAPLNKIESDIVVINNILKKAMIFGMVLLIIVVLFFAIHVVKSIQKTRNLLNKLALGDVHGIQSLEIKSTDELGEMAQSVNKVVAGLNKVTEFAEAIGEGNYNHNFEQLGPNDALGNAIIEMRNSLQKAKVEEELRKEEARQLEWSSQGLNLFNKVLRINSQSLENLAYQIVHTVTTYLEAHMGGVYIKNDKNPSEYDLTAFIGFNKSKSQNRIITPTSGLVGQCILERETIFINDVPADFDIIISGLGGSIPKSVLIVPLLHNKNLVGLLEIESLKMIQPYQIKFVERIAETIAATLATVKVNESTSRLLFRAKKQAEELEQQEEEMRQNMEEMQATQEEAAKREADLSSIIEGFSKMLPVIEYDKQGRIISVNDHYLKLLKTSNNQLIGKRHKGDLFMNDSEQIKHNEFWNNLINGHVQESLEYIKSGKDDYWIQEKFLPVKDSYGIVTKVLCVGIDITEQQKTDSKIRQLKERQAQAPSEKLKATETKSMVDLNRELTVIDLNYLKMVYKKDPVKIYNILKLYHDTLPSQLAEIEGMINNKDFVLLKPRINGLKTKMSYLGLKQVFDLLGNMEKYIGDKKNMTEIPALMHEIANHWTQAYAELQQLLNITASK